MNPDFTPLNEMGSGALYRAVVKGDTKSGSMMAGQIAGLINKEQSVEEIILDYVTEAKAVFQKSKVYFE